MSDILSDEDVNTENAGRASRPTLTQVKAVVAFMEKNPEFAHRKHRSVMGQNKFKKLWVELSNIANSINGAVKSTKGWIKFWSDKRRSIDFKKKQIDQGKLQGKLTSLEQKILELSGEKVISPRKKKTLKQEPCQKDDDNELDDLPPNEEALGKLRNGRLYTDEAEERQLNMIEKMVEVMNQQSAALTQMAQASLVNSKALERIADASHIQALAVDRLAGTFETISGSVHEVRNAILGIDYTMKRCYPPTATQRRQNSNIFS